MLCCGFIEFRKVLSYVFILYDLFYDAVSSWYYVTLSAELIVNDLLEETDYEELQSLWWVAGVRAKI
jgi:hypothetical protein